MQAESDTTKFMYRFIIVPLQINYSSSGKAQHKKTVQIKLGQVSAKCDQLCVPVFLDTEVLYSHKAKKFIQLKGIVKIYDVLEDGNEIISCVGAFETEGILNHKANKKLVQRSIGSTTFKMEISANPLSSLSDQQEPGQKNSAVNKPVETRSSSFMESRKAHQIIEPFKAIQSIPQLKSNSSSIIKDLQDSEVSNTQQGSKKRIKSSLSLNEQDDDIEPIPMKKNHIMESIDASQLINDARQSEKKKQEKGPRFERKKFQCQSPLEVSNYMSNYLNMSASVSCPQLLQEFQRKEIEMIGQQLIQQRRKNKMYEEKMEKQQLKINFLKSKNDKLSKQVTQFLNGSERFLKNLVKDERGKYIINCDAKLQLIQLQYNVTIQSQLYFQQFFTMLMNAVKRQNRHRSHDLHELCPNYEQRDIEETNKVMNIIENVYEENIKLQEWGNALCSELNQSCIKIAQLEKQLEENSRKMKQFKQIQASIKGYKARQEELKEMVKAAEGLNNYLKEKDQQMQYIITTKENTIDNLRKMLMNNNNELDEMEEQMMQYKKGLKNMELMIEEMKEELANKDEQIENYQLKYGKYKNKRSYELENQINDCLRWLNQQDTSNNVLEDTMKSDTTTKKVDRTVISIIKSSENMSVFSLNDLTHAYEELSDILANIRDNIEFAKKSTQC